MKRLRRFTLDPVFMPRTRGCAVKKKTPGGLRPPGVGCAYNQSVDDVDGDVPLGVAVVVACDNVSVEDGAGE